MVMMGDTFLGMVVMGYTLLGMIVMSMLTVNDIPMDMVLVAITIMDILPEVQEAVSLIRIRGDQVRLTSQTISRNVPSRMMTEKKRCFATTDRADSLRLEQSSRTNLS